MKTKEIVTFLEQVPLLSNLEEEELIELSKVCVEKSFDKGKIIFYEKDLGTSFYLIISGQVKIAVLSNDGREHILGILKEKDFFGELSIIDGQPRSTTVIAKGKVKTITISREDFINLLKNNPDIMFKIVLSLSTRLRKTDKHVSNLVFLSATGRIASTLLNLAEQQGVEENGEIIVNHKMVRQELANIAGTSRETLTRTLIDFQEEGIISAEKKQIIIHNKTKLVDKLT